MIEKAFTFGLIRLPMPRISPPAQMSKWFNTTYGFVMGIAAAALSITVVSAAVVGTVIGTMAFVVYINSHMKANSCMRSTKNAMNEARPIGKEVSLRIEQVNNCRKQHGLSMVTLEQVKKREEVPSVPWVGKLARLLFAWSSFCELTWFSKD